MIKKSSTENGKTAVVTVGIAQRAGTEPLCADGMHMHRAPHVFTAEAKAWLLGAKDTDFDHLLDL